MWSRESNGDACGEHVMDVNALVHGAPWAYGSSFVFVCRFVCSLVSQILPISVTDGLQVGQHAKSEILAT